MEVMRARSSADSVCDDDDESSDEAMRAACCSAYVDDDDDDDDDDAEYTAYTLRSIDNTSLNFIHHSDDDAACVMVGI